MIENVIENELLLQRERVLKRHWLDIGLTLKTILSFIYLKLFIAAFAMLFFITIKCLLNFTSMYRFKRYGNSGVTY